MPAVCGSAAITRGSHVQAIGPRSPSSNRKAPAQPRDGNIEAAVRDLPLLIEIDGRRVDAEALWSTASAYGHFTAMQVRGRRTRGLELHLRRLEAANTELFEAGLDRGRVCELIRHALGGVADASVRVYVFESEGEPTVMVTVRPPHDVSSPQRLQSVRYKRPDAHVKHLATGQGFYSRLARRAGFDDALLTADGVVSESATANIGFFDGSGVVWPDAPLLHGITMQLLERKLPELGVPSRRAPLRLQDITMFEGAFLSNARGVAAVSQVDDVSLPIHERMKTIADAYASVPWDTI
jgi:branched-subunit amino acid aminotransferase/4-amino-4-deoxychorismate lyase